jgi:hypothetical protein
MFDKDVIEGPVLLLFAANVEEATKVLTSNPDKVFRICRGSSQSFRARKHPSECGHGPSGQPENFRGGLPIPNDLVYPGAGGEAGQGRRDAFCSWASTSTETTTDEFY